MENNKYVVENDLDIMKAGFSGKTPYELERDAILKELAQYSEKGTAGTFLICALFGYWGLHCYLNGKVLRGVLYTCTLGGCFLLWLSDCGKILSGKFTDQNGKYINSAKVTQLNYQLMALDNKYANQ